MPQCDCNVSKVPKTILLCKSVSPKPQEKTSVGNIVWKDFCRTSTYCHLRSIIWVWVRLCCSRLTMVHRSKWHGRRGSCDCTTQRARCYRSRMRSATSSGVANAELHLLEKNRVRTHTHANKCICIPDTFTITFSQLCGYIQTHMPIHMHVHEEVYIYIF